MNQDRLFDITGRVALVTGSSRGIGHALARGLLEAGCVVVLNGKDSEVLARARDALALETGGKVFAQCFDVTDPGSRGPRHRPSRGGGRPARYPG